jgi:hypothetical protein
MSISTPPLSPSTPPAAPGGGGSWSVLLLNAVGPFVVFQALSRAGVDALPALAAAAVLPMVGTVPGWVRNGRPDAVGLLALLFLGVGIAVAHVTGSAQAVLYQGALLNVLSGVLCFVSLLWARPLVFYIGRQLTAGDDSEARARYDDLWRLPAFRAAPRALTVAWGAWGFAQAAARTVLTATLPAGAVLAVWPLVDLLVTVLLVSWSISYSRRSARSE